VSGLSVLGFDASTGVVEAERVRTATRRSKMLDSRQSPFVDLRLKLWKTRAQAKQTRLERLLAAPQDGEQDTAMRKRWIARALAGVRRAQASVKSRASLLDAYAEHLSVLEMTLMGAIEEKPAKPSTKPSPSGKTESSKPA
jgi:hypothetical protein